MNYFLVDYENVRLDGIKELGGIKSGDALIIFYSEVCKNISLEVLDIIAELELKYSGFKVNVGKKDALDFQLVTYLGYLIGKGERDAKYFIVSNDKGFAAVRDFWMDQNISVSCLSPDEYTGVSKEPTKKVAGAVKKKKSKIPPENLATLDEVKALIGEKVDAETVLKTFNQFKTKVAINNGLNKHFKDSKKSSEVYKKLKPLLKEKKKS